MTETLLLTLVLVRILCGLVPILLSAGARVRLRVRVRIHVYEVEQHTARVPLSILL